MQFLPLLLLFILPSTAQASVVRTPLLIQAVQSGHMPLIKQLISGSTKINVIDTWGRTATHYAVSNNNLPALKFLLDSGADVNLADNNSNTPLDMWHVHENKAMLELLHAAGAKPLDLWQAAANNDRASAERLLAVGADAKAENDAGKVPFDIAVEAEHYALAAVLAKAAGGINGRDKKGWTPLHWAVFSDAWDLVREFIREGADILAGYSQNAFDVATLMESEAKLIEVFIAEKGVDATVGRNGETMLMLAARDGHTDVVKFLIDNGVDLNHKDSVGWTALMFAATWERMEIVKLLIDNGADLNITNYGKTALMYAAWNGSTEVVKTLIEIGANINIQNDNGDTALILAARRGLTEIVKILVENGADMNIKDKYGWTALMHAAWNGSTEVVKFLIDNGADLNHKNNGGWTALMYASRYGYTEVVKLFIDNGADMNHKSNVGGTALICAAREGRTEVVKLLIDNGADMNIKDVDGWTALMYASSYGHTEIINILRAAQSGGT